MSLIEIKNQLDDESKPDGGFHQVVTNLVDKFYSQFSGHNMDYCFSNVVLNKHHKNEELKNLLEN